MCNSGIKGGGGYLRTIALKEEIEAFLDKARMYIADGKFDFIRGKQEVYTLSRLGISIDDCFGLVEELTYKHYYRGPSPDHNPHFAHEEIWEFGIEEVPKHIYIKLKFRGRDDNLLMMSFHYAERPIMYPYK